MSEFVKVTLPDGSSKEVKSGTRVADFTRSFLNVEAQGFDMLA